jgi:SAM-dependent methyltransferase
MSLSIKGEYLWFLFAKQSFAYEDQLKMVLYELPVKKYPRILELGCGVGYFLSKLDENGYECTGIDMNVERINLAKRLNKLWKRNCSFHNCRAREFRPRIKYSFDGAIWMNVPLDIDTLTDEFLGCIKYNVRKGGLIIFDYLTIDKENQPTDHCEWVDELYHQGDDFLPAGTYKRKVTINYSKKPWEIVWIAEEVKSGIKLFEYRTSLPTVNSSLLREIYFKHRLKHIKEVCFGRIEFDGVPSGLSFIIDLFVNENISR